jgi:hypothetical protein
MDLCGCASEEDRNGECPGLEDSSRLSDTVAYTSVDLSNEDILLFYVFASE